MPKKRSHYKHTLPCLARSTYNQLQQEQHDKASLVCVRVQSPSGLALVPCALSMVDLSGQLRCWITQTSVVQKNVFVFLFERSEFLIDTSQKKSLRVCTCARVHLSLIHI